MAECVKRNISIRRDQEDWLKKHPKINLSGLVQESIDAEMAKDVI